MQRLKALSNTTRFVLELAALAALGYWGFYIGQGIVPKICMAISVSFLVGLVWAAFVAPQSPTAVSWKGRLLLTLAFFLLAVVGLATTDHATLAGSLGLASILDIVPLAIWRH
jgi:hypothetical protein